MTNYPAEFGQSPFEMTFKQAYQQFFLALSMMTWSPRKWASKHTLAVDLPSAWWLAGHAIDMKLEMQKECNVHS